MDRVFDGFVVALDGDLGLASAAHIRIVRDIAGGHIWVGRRHGRLMVALKRVTFVFDQRILGKLGGD